MARKRRRQEDRAAELMRARRDALRERKAKEERRKILSALVPVLLVVFAFVGFGWYRLEWWEPRQPVAEVSGTTIRAEEFGTRVQFARQQALNNLQSIMGLLQTDDPSFITNYANQQRTGVVNQTLDQMIDAILIRNEAEARGITVTDEDVQNRLCLDLMEATGMTTDDAAEESETTEGEDASSDEESDDSETDGDSETEGDAAADDDAAGDDAAGDDAAGDDAAEDDAAEDDASGDDADDAAVATGDDEAEDGADEDASGEEPAAGAGGTPTECTLSQGEIDSDFETVIGPQLERVDMSRSEYEEIVRAQVYRDKLNEALGEEMETSADQVEVSRMLFTNDSVAEQAEMALDGGTPWDEVVERFRRPEADTVDAESGADLAAPMGTPGAEDAADDAAEDDTAADDGTEDDGAADEEAAEEDAAEDGGSEGDTDEEGAEESATAESATAESEAAEGDTEEDDAAEGEAAESEAVEEDAAEEEGTAEDAAGEETSEDTVTEADATESDATETEATEADSDATDEEGDADADDADAEGADAEGEEAEEDAAPPTMTPAPTPTPEPYAFEVVEDEWFTAERLRERFGLTQGDVDAIFAADAGEVIGPLEGNRGSFILHVESEAQEREIDEDELAQMQETAIDDWLAEARTAPDTAINRYPTEGLVPPEPQWFVDSWNQLMSSIRTQPSLNPGTGGAGTGQGAPVAPVAPAPGGGAGGG